MAHGKIVCWKGLIRDTILEEKQDHYKIDLRALKYNGFLIYFFMKFNNSTVSIIQ